MTGPVSGPMSLKKITQELEAETVKISGKTTNGHSVQTELPAAQADCENKTGQIAQDILPNETDQKMSSTGTLSDRFEPVPESTLKGSPELRARLPAAPTLPTEEELAKLESEQKTANAGKSTGTQSTIPTSSSSRIAKVRSEISSLWSRMQASSVPLTKATALSPLAKNLSSQFTKTVSSQFKKFSSSSGPVSHSEYHPPQNEEEKLQANQKLADQLILFKTALQNVTAKGSRSKITINEKGEINLTKRGLVGISYGRSEGTQKMIATLGEMKNAALNSDDSELLFQFIKNVQDLRDSNWGAKIISNNEFKEIVDSTKSILLRETANAAQDIGQSDDQMKLMNAAKFLSMARNLNCFNETELQEIEKGISKADVKLSLLDEEKFVDHLLGQNPHVEGRNLLLESIGETVKAEDFLQPMQEDSLPPIQLALKEIAEKDPESAEKALQSLTEFAFRLATTISPKDMDKPILGSTLREEIQKIITLNGNTETQNTALATQYLLRGPEDDLNSALEKFRSSIESNDLGNAADNLPELSFLSRDTLESPIYPDRANSPTVRQELASVRDWAMQNGLEAKVAVFDLLKDANAARPEKKSLLTTQAKDFQNIAYESIRSGGNGDNLKEALVKDFRSQFGGLIKNIEVSELRNNNFAKAETAPNIAAFSTTVNQVAFEVVSSITNGTSQQEVKNLIGFWIDTLDACVQDKNYAAAIAIYSGLNNGAILRITKRDGVLSKQHAKRLKSIDNLLSAELSSKNYRQDLAKSLTAQQKPIPQLNVIFSDLTFMTDGNPNKVDEKVNLIKAKMLNTQYNSFKSMAKNLEAITERKTDFFDRSLTSEGKELAQLENTAYANSQRLFPRQS